MKYIHSLRSVFVAMLVVAAAFVPAFGATSGTLSLTGVVPLITEITITPDPNAGALPIGNAVNALTIATVNERSNDKAGYTVSLTTANGATLKEAAGTDSLPYSLIYGGSPVTFSNGTAVISNATAKTGGSGTTNILAISFAAAFLNADTYTDTLTFTITGK